MTWAILALVVVVAVLAYPHLLARRAARAHLEEWVRDVREIQDAEFARWCAARRRAERLQGRGLA